MKICRYKYNEEIRNGIVDDNIVFSLKNGEDLISLQNQINLPEISIHIEKIELLSPVNPSKIVCVGRNYAKHAAELGNAIPKEPLLFLKAPSSIITDGDPIQLPKQSNRVEFEGELAVIIGRVCKNLTEMDDPFDYILGFTCLNDVTARDIQQQDVQFTRAKSFDTFCPISKFIETDLDTSDIRITTKINGLIKQDARTSEMVFPIDYLIRYISNQMTLNVGDIVATGTPSGVSKQNVGDICEVEIEGIGILKNPVE